MSYIDQANPYGPPRKFKGPVSIICETCEREIAAKYWRAHEASKKHRINKLAMDPQSSSMWADDSESPASSLVQADDASLALKASRPYSCHNCGKQGHFFKECPEPKSARNVQCHKCHEMGHFARDCPKHGSSQRTCHRCGKVDHISRDCSEPRVLKCHNCNEPGHRVMDCPQPRKPRNWSNVECRKCKQMGHGEKKCPNPPIVSSELSENHELNTGNGDLTVSTGMSGSLWDNKANPAHSTSSITAAWDAPSSVEMNSTTAIQDTADAVHVDWE